MSSIDVANTVCAWVENALSLPFTIYNDLIPDAESDGACLRHDPAPAAERNFSDRSRLVKWNLTFYVRCLNSKSARDYAKQIIDKLHEAAITDPDTGILIDCEASTLPQFISTDDKKLTTYSAAITCEYMEQPS